MRSAVGRTGHRSVLLRKSSANGGRAGVTPPNPRLRGRRLTSVHLIAAHATAGLIAILYLLYLFAGTIRHADSGPTDPLISAKCLLTGSCSAGSAQASEPSTPGFEHFGFEPFPEFLLDLNDEGRAFERGPQWPIPAQHSNKSGPATACVASAGLKKMPSVLRDQITQMLSTNAASTCAKAVEFLAPLRDQLYAPSYERAERISRAEKFEHAAAGYVQACLARDVLQDRGAPDPADENFLRSHTGLIVMRRDLSWASARPICHAARLGHRVITAQHCIPVNSEGYKAGQGPMPQLGFRFLDHDKVYPLTLRKLGNGSTAEIENRSRDFAVLEIAAAARELDEDIKPLLGSIELFGDFYTLTSNIYLRIANRHNGAETSVTETARIEHSVLCRPSYIAPNGLFLHACHTEAGVSGAPFFQRRNGRLVFVGIHNGITEALENRALASCAAGIPNYGITIAPSVLSGLR